jgi:hypothetical protein
MPEYITVTEIVLTFVIILSLLFQIYVLRNDKKSFWKESVSVIIITCSAILATTIGARLAINSTIDRENKNASESRKREYINLLKTEIKIDEHYIKYSKIVIDSINTKSQNYFESLNSISQVKESKILMEIINKGYVYEFSSEEFKNNIAEIIARLQTFNFDISKKNINSFKVLYTNLVRKQKFLFAEIEYLTNEKDGRNEKELIMEKETQRIRLEIRDTIKNLKMQEDIYFDSDMDTIDSKSPATRLSRSKP